MFEGALKLITKTFEGWFSVHEDCDMFPLCDFNAA